MRPSLFPGGDQASASGGGMTTQQDPDNDGAERDADASKRKPADATAAPTSNESSGVRYKYSIEDLKLMKEYPNSKLPIDNNSLLAQYMRMSQPIRARNESGTYKAPGRFQGDEPFSEQQTSLLGMPGNIRPSGPLAAAAAKASSVATEALKATDKAPVDTTAQDAQRNQSVSSSQGGSRTAFPPPPPPPPISKETEAKQVDERPPSHNMGAALVPEGPGWSSAALPPAQQKRPLLPTSAVQDLIYGVTKQQQAKLNEPVRPPPHLYGNRLPDHAGDVSYMDPQHAMYDFYGQRQYSQDQQAQQQYPGSGLGMWANTQDQDLWDSPVDAGDGDIFTLGDIRQAEHTIETQGISAESYADLRTRKIMTEVAERNRRQPRPEDDTFFPDVPIPDQPGESRFLNMFESNQRPAAPPTAGARPPYPPGAPSGYMVNTGPQYMQSQSSPVSNQPWKGGAPGPAIEKSPDKDLMREHLMKIIGVKVGSDGKAQQPGGVSAQDLLYKPMHTQQQSQQPAPGYSSMLTQPSTGTTRPPNVFSRPLNPAAPQFSPLGILNNLNPEAAHGLKKQHIPAPPPPPPTDYRRQQPGMYDMQPHQGMHQMPSPAHPLPMWSQRPSAAMGGQHPINMDAGLHQDELSQRLGAKAPAVAPKATNPVTEQQALAAAQYLQRHLMQNGNLSPEQVNQVLQFFQKNKGALLTTPYVMQQQAGQPQRRKEFDEAATKEQQAAALLQAANAQLQRQAAAAAAQSQSAKMQQQTAQGNALQMQQFQSVQKVLQAELARAGNRPDAKQLVETVRQQLQLQQQQRQKSTAQQQQSLLSMPPRQGVPGQPQQPPMGAPNMPAPMSAAAAQQAQQKMQFQNAIEKLAVMAQRMKNQQQQQGGPGPDMSSQQLLSQLQRTAQLQRQQQAQQQQQQQQQLGAQLGMAQGSVPGANMPQHGGYPSHLFDQQQQPRPMNSAPSSDLKQQLTNALTATIQPGHNKSEQALAQLSLLLKSLPPGSPLTQQFHAMLQQQQQARMNPVGPPPGGLVMQQPPQPPLVDEQRAAAYPSAPPAAAQPVTKVESNSSEVEVEGNENKENGIQDGGELEKDKQASTSDEQMTTGAATAE
eukprot:Blabericola_migrator_1__4874@NODE_254_length_10809_cov_136_023925_g213_i0_p1_GENE_NODE_254_length_10809_cov_136_023925_g213_i0NODE_254_length_10809_cov_136_023925_g213_i0_p1_ORF_typecomplete_len1100_score263_19SMC_N/PF02463_19/2_9_NODE_254_length_10809_cov_136_023925_g213_i012034502